MIVVFKQGIFVNVYADFSHASAHPGVATVHEVKAQTDLGAWVHA